MIIIVYYFMLQSNTTVPRTSKTLSSKLNLNLFYSFRLKVKVKFFNWKKFIKL